jgi:GTPase Era involved in 16S rRNA processing
MVLKVQPPPAMTEDRLEKLAVILMGVTGSGKSTFISLLTDQNVEVGHGLESHTTEAASYTFIDNQKEIILVDTPGFDDTTRPDAEILKEMVHSLLALHDSNVRLAGIVHLHRITDPRFSGTAVKNLEILQRLCGPSNFDSVALVMNMWDSIDIDTATQRASELRQTFWAPMLQGNSKMASHAGTRESALQIVRALTGNAKPRLVLSIQHELAVEGKTLDTTAAGQYVQKEMLEAQEKHQQDMSYLKSSMDDAFREKDVNLLRTLREERDAAEAKVRATVLETEQLNITLYQLMTQKEYHRARKLPPPSNGRQSSQPCVPSHDFNSLSYHPAQNSYTSIPMQKRNFAASIPTTTLDHTSLGCNPYPPRAMMSSGPTLPLHGAQHHCVPECKQRCEEEDLQLRLRKAEEDGRSLKREWEHPTPGRDPNHRHEAGYSSSERQGGRGHSDSESMTKRWGKIIAKTAKEVAMKLG